MKRTLIILLSLLLTNAAVMAQFGVKGKSKSGRRSPGGWNGYLDTIFVWTSGVGGSAASKKSIFRREPLYHIAMLTSDDKLLVIDGGTEETFWTFDYKAILGVDDVELLGYPNFKNNEETHALLFHDGHEHGGSQSSPNPDSAKFWIVDIADNTVEFSMEGVRPLGVDDFEGDGTVELLVFEPNEKRLQLVGFQDQNSTVSRKSVLHSRPPTPHAANMAFEVVLKFESEQGRRMFFEDKLLRNTETHDIDGDDITDVPMLVEDANGNPGGLRVLDGSDFDIVKFEYFFPEERKTDILKAFHGFFDIDADGTREMVVGDNLVITLDGMLHEIDPNFAIRSILDVDNDGFPDLIGENSAGDTTVQVWGKETATSVSEENLVVAGFQLQQNYPNPFNPSTTISYSVKRAAVVELKIYDVLGRQIRTLINENQPRALYEVVWDGKDDSGQQVASGHYFYQLKAGEFLSTRRMVLLK